MFQTVSVYQSITNTSSNVSTLSPYISQKYYLKNIKTQNVTVNFLHFLLQFFPVSFLCYAVSTVFGLYWLPISGKNVSNGSAASSRIYWTSAWIVIVESVAFVCFLLHASSRADLLSWRLWYLGEPFIAANSYFVSALLVALNIVACRYDLITLNKINNHVVLC